MRGRRIGLLLVLVVGLPLAAGVLVAGTSPSPAQVEDGAAFQHLVGGLGFGPAVDLTRCGREFDPRVEGTCALRHEPVPCGSIFCPPHAE